MTGGPETAVVKGVAASSLSDTPVSGTMDGTVDAYP